MLTARVVVKAVDSCLIVVRGNALLRISRFTALLLQGSIYKCPLVSFRCETPSYLPGRFQTLTIQSMEKFRYEKFSSDFQTDGHNSWSLARLMLRRFEKHRNFFPVTFQIRASPELSSLESANFGCFDLWQYMEKLTIDTKMGTTTADHSFRKRKPPLRFVPTKPSKPSVRRGGSSILRIHRFHASRNGL